MTQVQADQSIPPTDLKTATGLEDNPARMWMFFVFLWGQFAFIHQALEYWDWFQFGDPVRLLISGLVFLAAIPVMLRPANRGFLALLAVLWLCELVLRMPRLPNHMLLAAFVNATILTGIAWRMIRPAGGLTDPRTACAALYRDLAPLLRLYLIILYFYAVLHKLNWDYMNPMASCGVQLYQDICAIFPFLPTGEWTHYPTLLGALAMEAIIPLLLIFRKTRTVGVIVGLFFHYSLALHYNLYIQSFSTMLLAFYALFLPTAFADQLVDWWTDRGYLAAWRRNRGRVRVAGVVFAVLVVVAYLGGAASQGMLNKQGLIEILHTVVPPVLRWGWFVLLIFEAYIFFSVLWRVRSWRLQPSAGAALWPMLVPATILLPILFLNGLSPYLGLKTGTSFAMFSNLRTEADVNNHLFVPHMRIASYQDDMVKVLGSSLPIFQGMADREEQLPMFELRTKIADARERGEEGAGRDAFFVEIERGGVEERVTLTDTPDHIALQVPPWYERKFLHFRAVPYDGEPCTCRH